MKNLKSEIVKLIKDERGTMPQLSWQAGATAVTVLIIVALAVFLPDEIRNITGDILDWALSEIGIR